MQVFEVIKRPPYGLLTLTVSLLFSLLFLYFDEFIFFFPFPVADFPIDRAGLLLLDLAISISSGLVLSISLYQVRNFPRTKGVQGSVGSVGIIAAFIAGACPCYYLFPLLALTGGVGGVLGLVGITFFTYQIPIKLTSLVLMVVVSFTLERSLRAACSVGSTVLKPRIAP